MKASRISWGLVAIALVAALILLAGCAAEGGYQRSEAGYYQAPVPVYYRVYEHENSTTSGGAWIGPPPGAGG
jgi:hypothetical protein